MGFLSFFNSTTNSKETGAGDSDYSNDEILGVYKDLSYQECRDIYRYWSLGKRIATSLPNFAMSAPRTFKCGEHPADVADAFRKTCEEMCIDNTIKKATIYARVYGLSSIFVSCSNNEILPITPITYRMICDNTISFNVLDPLSMGANIQIDNNPLSYSFQKPINITVGGKPVHTQRICTIYNDIPLYLKFNPSTYSFSGASIYQNMTLLIRSWNRCVIALQRLATKAGSIIKTSKEISPASGINLNALRKNLELIRNMENDGIANIQSGEEVNFFALTGVQEIDAIIQSLNTSLMMALSDTPSGILLDKNLSVGLNDGTEDMKAILMAVEHFREQMLRPLYNFVDKFIMYKAWTPEFIMRIKNEYRDMYGNMTYNEIFHQWKQDFLAEFGELYPQTEREKMETAKTKLDMLEQLRNMGANDADIETALNQNAIFDGIDFVLNQKGDDENEGEDLDNWGSEIELDEENEKLKQENEALNQALQDGDKQ